MEDHRGLWATSNQIPIIKKELRSLVQPLNYIDVRRHRFPIYDAISRELLEDGCTECAIHFERLSDMENYLFDMRIIKNRILETKGLLEAIIENARIAERNCKMANNHELALRTLFQTALLLDRRECNEYNWLTKEMYLIVTHFMNKWSNERKYPEKESRVRYFFGKFLLLKDHNYVGAIEELKEALELSKCKQWYTAKETYNYLSVKSRVYLCKAYLCEAARIQKKDKVLAEELATHAIASVWEGRLPKDVKLFCEANLRKGFYSIRLKNYEKTLSLYKKVQPYIYSLMLPEFKCEMFLHQGICYLNLGNNNLAIRKLKQAIRLGEIYNLKIFHAHALLQIGKLYSKSHSTYNLSQKAFIIAREIYTELKDDNNLKKVNYLAAKLKSEQILPKLVHLIHGAETEFCDKLTLHAWKDSLEIFWIDDLGNQEEDSIGKPDDIIDVDKDSKELTQVETKILVVEQSKVKIAKETGDEQEKIDEKIIENEVIQVHEEEQELANAKDDIYGDDDDNDSKTAHKCIFKRMP